MIGEVGLIFWKNEDIGKTQWGQHGKSVPYKKIVWLLNTKITHVITMMKSLRNSMIIFGRPNFLILF